MKKITILLVVAVAVGAAYYLFMMPEVSQVPTDTASGQKLDINVVCESALAYMTFQSGEEAAQFVADCKAGEHPEVIERYKSDMGLGDGAAI